MAKIISPLSINTTYKICDDQTKYLISGYIREYSDKFGDIDLIQVATYYYYADHLSPFIEFAIDRKWIVNNQKTFDEAIKKCTFSDKILLHPGLYKWTNTNRENYYSKYHLSTTLTTITGLHFIGVGARKDIIFEIDNEFNDAAKFISGTFVSFENVTLRLGKIGTNWMGIITVWDSHTLILNECTIEFEDRCIGVDDNASLYVSDCLFQGTGASHTAITILPNSNKISIINSTFVGCGYIENNSEYGTDCVIEVFVYVEDDEGTITVKIWCIGNTFVNTVGYPIVKGLQIIPEYVDKDDDWWNKELVHVIRDNTVSDVNNDLDANTLYTCIQKHNDFFLLLFLTT